MSIVVEASVLVAAAADSGPEGRWAEDIVAQEALAAPQLVLVEATNILRRLEAAGQIESPLATAAHRDLLELRIELFPFRPLAERVWELRSNLTSYDAWYVAIAELIEAPLATLDRKLTRASGPRCDFLKPD